MTEVAYVALLDVQAGQRLDPEAPAFHPGAGGPVSAWPVSGQGSTPVTMLSAPGGLVRARYMADVIGPPNRGLFALFGPKDDVESMGPVGEIMPLAEMDRKARENDATAKKMQRACHTHIVDDDDGVEHKVTILTPGGQTLPATLPSPAVPFGPSNVTQVYRAAIMAYGAGHADHMQRLADEPDRDP